MHINQHKVGLALGSLFGGLHLVWSFLVLVGWAAPIMSFVFWAHMVETTHQVGTFAWTPAITLVILTFIVGYVVGCLFGWLWNKVRG